MNGNGQAMAPGTEYPKPFGRDRERRNHTTRPAPVRSLAATQDAGISVHGQHRETIAKDRTVVPRSAQPVGRAMDDVLHRRPQARVLDLAGITGVSSAMASRSASFTVCVDRSLPMLVEVMANPPSMVALPPAEVFDGLPKLSLRNMRTITKFVIPWPTTQYSSS